MTELPTYHGICPYCASAVWCVTRDGMTYARCSHRGCGARGPIMRSLDRAVEMFKRGRAAQPEPPDAVPHKAASDAAIERMRTMSRDELLATLVAAGIVDAEGRLTEAYRPDPPDAGRCEECADGAYPYYGGAPGRDYAGPSEEDFTYTDRDGRMHTIPAGTFIFAQRDPAPREQWPANFTEDPDCPGLGTWSCPKCSTGRTEAEKGE